VQAGLLSPEMPTVWGADAVHKSGRLYRQQRNRELLVDPAGSENLCMYGISMRENREVPCLPDWLITGRDAQGRSRPQA
jgi:hypothetical protein